jgi:hypothetical protein
MLGQSAALPLSSWKSTSAFACACDSPDFFTPSSIRFRPRRGDLRRIITQRRPLTSLAPVALFTPPSVEPDPTEPLFSRWNH